MGANRYGALFVPLNDSHTEVLVLADNALDDLGEGMPQPELPAGWKALKATDGLTIVYDPEADHQGQGRVQIQELRDYYWEIRILSDEPACHLITVSSSLQGSNRAHDWMPKRSAGKLHGTFKFVNYLGGAWIEIRHANEPNGSTRFRFDVITAKLDYESEYRAMVEAIASECQQLLLEWDSPTTLHVALDTEKQAQILLERFLFLRHVLGPEKLDLFLETLRRNPNTRLESEQNWRPASISSPTLFLKNPIQHGRDWMLRSSLESNNHNDLQALEIREERRFDSLDTPANRFVKFALKSFRGLCEEVMSATIAGRILQQEQGTAWREANSMKDALDSFLGSQFFGDVGEMRRIPFESQVLQKREGYREILHAWLMLDAAAQIDWPGRNDAYDGTNKDVATLYEYWLFFVLVRAFRERLGMTPVRDPLGIVANAMPYCCKADDGRMAINLKRGQESFCRFTWRSGEGRLRLHFFYNRQFKRSTLHVRGTYSRGFRPDYSLVIIPWEFDDDDWQMAEEKAEKAGQIAYLHFDAKYRVENLAGVFGVQSADEADDHLEAKATGTVKNADLYKMHTYNDAIRRTVGSYVLYPGDDPKNDSGQNRYERYREIVPGIGAFALKPRVGDATQPDGLPHVLEFVRDLLGHQVNRFSQSYRIGYWTESTIREPLPGTDAMPQNVQIDAKPPKDTQILLGYVRDEATEQWCKRNEVFFCHAVEWSKETTPLNDSSRQPSDPTSLDFDPFRSDRLAVYHKAKTAPWIAKVVEVRLASAAERAAETNELVSDMHAAYYYRFQLADIEPMRSRDISAIVKARHGKPLACSLFEFAASPGV